jgi:peptidoglycan/LPS O-acetylase OafA/YrhL
MGLSTPTTSSATPGPVAGYRTDIEGMRAIAVGLVLLYHAGVGAFGGGFVGVDVFFVISGFLITGVMLKEIDRTGGMKLSSFWARRARRLLPAAFVVLVAAAVVSWLLLPITQRTVFGNDIIAAALYVANWRLAGRSVDYLAEAVGASPVQHFWSLAVEEQFYIVWPLLVIAAIALSKRTGRPVRGTLSVWILIVVAASLTWSIASTLDSPVTAYFSTFTRLWQLGIGALLAIKGDVIMRLPGKALSTAGWVGLVGVLTSGVLFSGATPWPSYWALVPTISAALLLVSGVRTVPNSPYRLLSVKPAVWLGGLSYSVYLWHWLLIVAAQAVVGELSLAIGVFATAVSIVPAWLTQKLVENPLRFGDTMQRSGPALSVGGAAVVASVVAGALVVASIGDVAPTETSNRPLGAAVLTAAEPGSSIEDSVEAIVPDPLVADQDLPDAYDGGCQVGETMTEARRCLYGTDGDPVVMLVGDSKAVQWEPALQIIAERSGWQLQVMAKSGCAFSTADQIRKGARYTACREWNDAAMAVILEVQPDLILVSNLARQGIEPTDPDDARQDRQTMANGYAERWSELTALGFEVAVILDNPNPMTEVYECVAQNRQQPSVCTFDLVEAVSFSGAESQTAALASVGSGVGVIDLTPYICPEDCPPVIGGVLVYRQSSHLTRTYVESLVPMLADGLTEITDGRLG